MRFRRCLVTPNRSSMSSGNRCGRVLASLLSSLALLDILGGHWAVLQATAWVGMLVKYSEAEGVEVGISKTFDGKHPCTFVSVLPRSRLKRSKARSLPPPRVYLIAHAQRWTLRPPRYSWRLRDHNRFTGWLRQQSTGSSSSGVLRAGSTRFQSCFHGTLGKPSHPNRESRSRIADFSHPKKI